jgi:hypothetical protein
VTFDQPWLLYANCLHAPMRLIMVFTAGSSMQDEYLAQVTAGMGMTRRGARGECSVVFLSSQKTCLEKAIQAEDMEKAIQSEDMEKAIQSEGMERIKA